MLNMRSTSTICHLHHHYYSHFILTRRVPQYAEKEE